MTHNRTTFLLQKMINRLSIEYCKLSGYFLKFNLIMRFFRNQISKFVEDGSDEQVLPQCNAFIRRLIYQNVKEKLKNKVNLETRTVNGDRVLVVTKPKSKQEKIKDEQKRVETELEGLENALGFTKVLRAIVNSVRKSV